VSEGYDLQKSKKSVHELYPVLKDAHGNVIDGFHRLEADPNWKTETLEHIKTPAQLALARIISNTHRRSMSREERKLQIVALAKELIKEGLPREKVVPTIAELAAFTDAYIRMLLSDEYKREYVKPEKTQLSCELEAIHGNSELSSELGAPDQTQLSCELKPTREEIFAFLNRFKYEKDIDGVLLDNMIELFGLSASQALDWLGRWREARYKSPRLTPEEKASLREYERTHPKEDDPFKKLVKYYPPELMDTVLSRLGSNNFETILKYCRKYVQELHDRATDDLRRAILEAIKW